MITDSQRQHLIDGIVRNNTINTLHRAGQTDAKLLHGLVGMRCKKFNAEYEITHIGYGFDGFITARGRRVLKATGKPGSRVWDIGPITARAFE